MFDDNVSTLRKLVRFLRRRYHARRHGKDLAWYVDRKAQISRWRIELLRNRHKGQRCFIIGNGPSLRKMDLKPLRGECTIGLNRIYLLFDDMEFATTYHVCVNKLVLEQFGTEISVIPSTKFVAWKAKEVIPFTADMMFLQTLPYPQFSFDLTNGMWEGTTVTYVAMQVAYHLGFQRVILIGVDHDFKTKGQPNAEVVSQGDDQSHFTANYFPKGIRWQLPDLETSETAYRLAKIAFETTNREIVDATVGGKLHIFPKVRYNGLF